MTRSIREIVKLAGGVHAIAEASQTTDRPVGFEAVYKWSKIGIDERHWPLLLARVAKLTPAELFAANQAVRNGQSGKAPKRPRKKPRARRAVAALDARAA